MIVVVVYFDIKKYYVVVLDFLGYKDFVFNMIFGVI